MAFGIEETTDAVAGMLHQVAEMVEQQNFIPPATTLLALRRINGAIAKSITAHGAYVDDQGNAIRKEGPQLA